MTDAHSMYVCFSAKSFPVAPFTHLSYLLLLRSTTDMSVRTNLLENQTRDEENDELCREKRQKVVLSTVKPMH